MKPFNNPAFLNAACARPQEPAPEPEEQSPEQDPEPAPSEEA